MTPAEKAQQLVDKFCNMESWCDNAKECALIAVDEVKEQLTSHLDNEISGIHAIYWEKVKQEIEKL